jgi:hypothetical protein
MARMGEMRNTYRILVGKLEGNKSLGRSVRGWEDDIAMNLGEVVWVGVDWIHLAQDGNQWRALVNTAMNLRVP